MGISALTPKRLWGWGALLLLVVVLAVLPLFTTGYTPVLMTSIFMYIVLTVSWVIFSGPTNYISLAPAAFFGIGIYTMAILGGELPLLVVVILGGLFSFILALLTGALTLRLRGIYFTIFTFGLLMLIYYVLMYWEYNITGTRGRFVILESNTTVYYIMFGILVATMITTYIIRRSKWGLALQSIGQNEEAAAHTGVNVTLVKVVTFAISALFMGAAGAIMATRWTYIDPSIAFKPLYSFLPVLMAIFGGMGRLYGPVIGAAIFAYLQELLTTKFPELYMLIFGVVLICAILFMPNGLVGVVDWLIKWVGLKLRRGGSAAQNADT